MYGTVTQNDGAIGYVELAYAIQNKLPANLPRTSRRICQPVPGSTHSAMNDFRDLPGDKLAISIVDGPGKALIPIAGYTYILLYMDQQDCVKAAEAGRSSSSGRTARGPETKMRPS